MSTAICLLSEEFLCSICLDVFADPVSTPCGHNFCKNCITKHWDISVFCQCPVCKKGFYTRPELQVNIFIYKMVAHFKQSTQLKASSSSSQQQAAKPGEVPCDVCTGTKLKALKSCLVCLTSYCETHLEPHLTATSLKRHQLIDPVENLEGRMCTKHNKLLELFCKTDETCVCMFCTVLDHKAHEVVPLKEGCKGMKVELVKTEAELQQMIKERRLKIQEIKHSVEVSRANADREMAGSNQVFTKMKDVIEGNQGKVIKMLEEKHQTTVKQAESFIKELEQEISELEKRSTELEQISNSEDHLHLLQKFQSLNAAPPTKDWKEVRVLPLSYGIITRTAVAQFVEMFKNEMKKLFPQLKEVQQYAVDVKLDPDTAHDKLILSDDGKQVHYSDAKRNLPNNPKRFSYWPGILGKQSFSSGRFYFEVQVKGKIDWVLGVSTESVKRKGWFTISSNNGFWTVSLKNGNIYSIRTDPPVHLPLKSKPEQVGVFVDYEEGLVSFYDVDAAIIMCSFNGCSFTEKLLPFFFPGLNLGGENSAPLIICPVEDTE